MSNLIQKRSRGSKGRYKSYKLPTEEIVELYKSGISELALSKKHRVSRSVIRKRLVDSGIHIRSHSEARILQWVQMSPKQRKRQVAKAHKATKGRKVSWESKCRHAQTIEKNPSNFSKKEIELKRMLKKRGLRTIHQKAIGGYNCDLATYPVAVEIFGGHWHFTGRHARRFEKRTKYFLNSGWSLLIIVVSKRWPLTFSIADYVAAYIKRARRQKTDGCEYRVIWGTTEHITRGSLEDNNFSLIPPFCSSKDPATGRYKRALR